ncbi:hypothetical protein PSECIP111951_00324 [Pseudoalteromonas holothuriae]|uniref:Flagellar motor switch protein FliN-like C-terminal domain-containing protein n=1 Tax=Pseudoalteromonas holothuriae TaxID=2963714 RepID=A0ABM9GED6_9GAMM|nr:FliM/FliN family flagellar motor C-terminal domain-containing protein [Pseudoalteromonas sp. CIP111951]CAH9051081.1 hypothetical protein PSECIP111951_00324 [Pseudoalteromonas sp. CIP111951]
MSVLSAGVFDKETRLAITSLLNKQVSKWQKTWFSSCKFDVNIVFNEQLFCALSLTQSQMEDMHESGISIYADTASSEQILLQQMFNCNENTMQVLLQTLDTDPIDNVYFDLRNKIFAGFAINSSVKNCKQQPVIKMQLTSEKASLSVYLTADVIQMWLESSSSDQNKKVVSPLKQAAKYSLLPMRVSLKTEPVNFVDVMCLKQGDVIMLKQEVEKPIPVGVNQADNVASGYLVERDNSKAIIFLES